MLHPLFNAVEASVAVLPAEKVILNYKSPETKGYPLLKVSGNILYDVNYRSRIDTPYAENNVYQHTLQTRLDFVYRGQYPFKIYLTTRFSNSSLFSKYTDLNFQYLQTDFARLLKKRLTDAVTSYLSSKTGELDSLRKLIERRQNEISLLSRTILKPDFTQKLVEEQERVLFGNVRNKLAPGLPQDDTEIREQVSGLWKYKFPGARFSDESDTTEKESSKSSPIKYYSYTDSIEYKKAKLDSLLGELDQLKKLYRKVQSLQQFNRAEWGKEIEEAKDARTLAQKLRQLNMPDTLLPRGYKTLYSIQSLSIGRSVANYSELSVRNTSITGMQLEYNPRYYYAFAVGKIDYRYRDYILPDHLRSRQYVALVRFGKGTKNGNHVFLTYYTGKRQFFNGSVASLSNNPVPEYNLAGITVEGVYKLGRNTLLTGEIAKSTIPYYSLDSARRKEWMHSVTRFNDRSNEAFSVRLSSYLPRTKTRLAGAVRYMGANFQSFSTFTTGAAQTKWLTKVEQPFFQKRLTIIASVQQNDYNNPFASTAYKSSSVLTSLQANLRIKKWPVFSAGYYPSYQLTKTGDNQYSESRYYTLVANASYYYRVHSVQFTSYAVYSQFYNQAADSGFVYFNSSNLLLSQNMSAGKFSVLLNASISANSGYNIYTIENNDQFVINRVLTAGGGVKMIRHTFFDKMQWGYSGNIMVKIPRLGDIQLMMDKGFIPGLNRQLVENKSGRLTYFKTL